MTSSLQLLTRWVEKQAAPGPPPREGLKWKPTTHRWIRPKEVSSEDLDTQDLESLLLDNPKSQKVLDTLSQHGKPYLVGGGVRDALLGRPSKDVDIEVHGIEVDDLAEIVERDLGGKKEQVGKQFGVFVVDGFDIALPRTEVKTGTKHTDFDVKPDPNLALEHAAKRRDFTINALMYDYESGEILDFFGGQEDLDSRTIKHIDEKTFVEDPLRVYRAAQFAARFGFSIDPSTQELARSMDLSSLPKERIFEEFSKMLLQSDSPSLGLQALDDMDVLKNEFPELHALKATPQRDDYHAEGNVFIHTKMVIDKAAKTSKTFSDKKDRQIVMLGALCHDLGKPLTTDDKSKQALGHSEAGIPVTLEFLNKLTDDKEIIETVMELVELHLTPLQYYRQREEIKDSTLRRLINRHGTHFLNLLTAVSEADGTGRLFRQSDGSTQSPTNDANEWFRANIKRVSEESGSTAEGKIKPLITGKDLIGLGFKQGKQIGEVLQEVQRQQEEGTLTTLEDAKKYVSDVYKSIEKQVPPGPPPREGLRWKPTTHRWIRPREESVSSDEVSIDFDERLELPKYTEEQKAKSLLRFPDIESVAGLIERGESIPRYWSHVPPSDSGLGLLGPTKEGGIQAYPARATKHKINEALAVTDKFKDRMDQKIVWLSSPATPNDASYVIDASKLNLFNVGAEFSGFQHAGDIPPEALVKRPTEESEEIEEEPIKLTGSYDAFKRFGAPRESYVDERGEDRSRYSSEAYTSEYMTTSDETNRRLRWAYQLSDGRQVSLQGYLKLVHPELARTISSGPKGIDRVWPKLSFEEKMTLVDSVPLEEALPRASIVRTDSWREAISPLMDELTTWLRVNEHPLSDVANAESALADGLKKYFYAEWTEILQGLRTGTVEKQAPPGPPPREGLRWKPQTRRWIRPKTGSKIDPDEYVSPFQTFKRKVAKNDLFKAYGQLFKNKIDDDSSPEYEQFVEVFSWLMGFSGPSGKSAQRIKMAKGDPEGSYVFQDYRNAVSMALVGLRYPKNNSAPIPKRHIRKIIDITLSSESKEMEKNAVSLGGDSQQIAGRMTKPSPRYQPYSERGWRGAKLTGSKMELFEVENRSQRTPYDFAQTVVHEMAHGVYFDLPFWYRIRVEHLYIKAVHENEGLPSQYSKENESEFFSECYTAYVTDTDAFRERNPSMANELDMVFSKTLKDKFPKEVDRDAVSELFMELSSGISGEHRDALIKDFESDARVKFPDWSDEIIAGKFGLTLDEYLMHQWNRDNWPTESSRGDTIKEEQLVFMVEKTLVSEDPIVIEDPEDAIGFTEDLPNADPIDMPAISEDSFADADEEEEELELQAPPGPPPRYGLKWKPSTHRWIRPEEFDVPDQPIHQLEETQKNQIQSSLDDSQNEGKYGTVKSNVDDEISAVALGFGFVEAQSPIQEEVENIKEKTTRAIQTVINNPETAVWTRVPEASLRKILGEGIFRTSHETGKTAPGKPAAKGGRLQEYLDQRKRLEISNFGEDANPIYAYLSDHEEGKLRERKVFKSRTATSSPKDHYEDVAVMYGNMRVKLKPQIRQKTTITGGDSYDNIGELYHQFMSDIDYKMFPNLFGHLAMTQTMSEDFHKGYKRGMEAHFPRKPEQREALRKGLVEFESRIENGEIKLKDLTYNYIEAQIHGGLSVNDIEEIIIDYRWNKSAHQLDIDEDGNPNVSPQLLKSLDDLGISWRFGSMPSKENIYKMMLVGELWNQ